MTDLILGAISNYNFEHIALWVNSLKSIDFKGRCVLMCYNIDANTQRKLHGYGIEACIADGDMQNICVDRFLWYYQLLSLPSFQDIRYVVATDVRDVVFQKDPIKWIESKVYNPKVIVSSESILYEDEHWGVQNFQQSYPFAWDKIKKRVILNAGVMAGDAQYMRDLFLQIYLTSRAAPYQHVPGGGGPDQAAYNLLMNSKPWYDVSRLANSESGWAAQLGTTGPQVRYGIENYLVELQPLFENGIVTTSKGEEFSIVHQYDRVPELRTQIEKRYAST